MTRQRVVVTGMGVISALGHDCSAFWRELCAGRPAFRPLENLDAGTLHFATGAQVSGFDPAASLEPRHVELLDRFAQFALVAAREAVRDSAMTWKGRRNGGFGVIMGSSFGQNAIDSAYHALYAADRPRVHPLTIPRVMPNASTSCISIEFGLTGPAFTVSTACSSSNHAIGQAFWLVRHGVVDGTITGGSDAPFSFGNLKAWDALRVVSTDICRPFSKDRNGMLLGEGAGVMVIESLDHALARGARIHAEIIGFGMSADACHVVQPTIDGPAEAMQAALDDAALQPSDVDYINAHGTGTPMNDKTEASAIRRVFGEHAGKVAVSSTKSMHGHALCAAGALEGIATVLALRDGLLPPNANYTVADPECDLAIVVGTAKARSARCALSNSFAFGGLNAVLAFQRWDG